jgi:NADH-quinone oxidoreductase subunit N
MSTFLHESLAHASPSFLAASEIGSAAARAMGARLLSIQPEIALFLTTCIVMVMGLSRGIAARRMTAWVAGIGLFIACVLSVYFSPVTSGLMPHWLSFTKTSVCVVGLLLLLLAGGTVDRREEDEIALGTREFNPLRTNRAEFYSFFLFSLTGVMLCASASDLIWLFLALELTSLPTYIMVTLSRGGKAGSRAQEAGVKYFFLGALGAATFLYGFALIYGGTGSTKLAEIASIIAQGETINPLTLAGVLMAIIGICFKIAAVPMHFYTADVYEGAASPVSAFLAFAPKAAGFFAMILICSLVGWTHGPSGHALPELVRLTLWVIAALTMTVGNVLALLQHSVKRVLAYSSIAHSGYMLVGVIAGPNAGAHTSGLSAVLFYLLCYGLMNAGCFAVLACLERQGPRGEEPVEIERLEDLKGLRVRHPALAWTMVLCALGLMGFPPLLGFFAKLPLFAAGVSSGEIALVIVLGLNSAIAAYYYLRLVSLPLLDDPDANAKASEHTPFAGRSVAALVSCGAALILWVFAGSLLASSGRAVEGASKAEPHDRVRLGDLFKDTPQEIRVQVRETRSGSNP